MDPVARHATEDHDPERNGCDDQRCETGRDGSFRQDHEAVPANDEQQAHGRGSDKLATLEVQAAPDGGEGEER